MIDLEDNHKHDEDKQERDTDSGRRKQFHGGSIAVLEAITQDGMLTWYCQAREFQGDPPCGMLNTSSLDEVSYQEARDSVLGKGAVIALPACSCGAITYLKADYSLKELYRATIKYEENGLCVHALPYRYVYNLAVHWQLYQQGKAAYAPVIDMPPGELLEYFEGAKPILLQAMWFGWHAVRAIAPHELAPGNVLQLIPAPDEVSI